MLTKKYYELIATRIDCAARIPEHFYVSGIESQYVQGVYSAAVSIALALADDNPKFDRARFLKACGVQS